MNENNKKTLVQFLKVLSVFLLGFIALITNVEIFNMAAKGYTDGFHVVVAILNLIAEGFGVYFYQKAIGAFDEFSGKAKKEEEKPVEVKEQKAKKTTKKKAEK